MRAMLDHVLTLPPRFERLLPRSHPTIAGIVLAAAVLCLAAFDLPAVCPNWADLSTLYLLREDRWLLLCDLVLLVGALLCARCRVAALTFPTWAPYAFAAGIFCFCLAGHRWILDGYDLSGDEQMAVFDSWIFAHGRLAQELPALWQAHAGALNPQFMLPVAHPIAWVSSYLPMNAAFRTLVGLVADPAATGPLMSAFGLLFLWRCARLLWPQDREAAVVAALLYVGSGQILFAGMTAYAMPGHLTLNLLWLWLFFMRRRVADAGALVVAFVATGLHQPLFHPMFAFAFLVGLVRDRCWTRVAFYTTGYATICAFWLAWPMVIHARVAGSASQALPTGTDYFSRLVATVLAGDEARWADMGGNLLRFVAWQPVLLLPLMAAGVALARRERPTTALAVSAALPIVVMAFILPYQGHGFGYRYLHGVLGSAILLAVQGWRHLVRREEPLRPLLISTTIAGLLVTLPLQAWMTHALYAPNARADADLRTSGADYAIIDRWDASFAKDLVLDRPDLSNRPIRLLAEQVDDPLIAAICRPGIRVAMPAGTFFAQIDALFLNAPSATADARLAQLSPKLRAAGCTVERLDRP